MANQEHLAILGQQGVAGWNEWRARRLMGGNWYRARRVDLSGADLTGKNLRNANLQGVDLTGARLTGARLEDADFRGAVLLSSDLSEADLRDANCGSADLSKANLFSGLLGGCNFTKADLSAANLTGTQLGGSRHETGIEEEPTITTYSETVFVDTDLTGTIGLETCEHIGPSYLDFYTVMNSGNQLPMEFMVGCGLPIELVTLLKALPAAHFYSCFISYSTKDEKFATRLHADLRAKGVRCRFAPEDLKIGDNFPSRIYEFIHSSDKLLLILSRHSIASSWVEDEVETALERERREHRSMLFPIYLDEAIFHTDVAWAAHVGRRHIGNFSGWIDPDAYSKAFEVLLRNLKADSSAETRKTRTALDWEAD